MKKILVIVLGVVLLASHGSAARFFTDKRSAQVGGGIIFQSTGYEDVGGRDNYFEFSPIVNFFPVRYFLVGPVFDISVWGNGVDLSMGGRAGFAYGNDIPVVPFLYASPQALISKYNNETDAGFGMEFHGGIIIPIQRHFSINLGPGFWFQVVDGNGLNRVFMAVSVTGLVFLFVPLPTHSC